MSHLQDGYMVGIGVSEGHLEANTEEDGNNNLLINVSVSTNTFKNNFSFNGKMRKQISRFSFMYFVKAGYEALNTILGIM